ncbi:MAG: hypothetical protein PHZ25_03595 [Candidatus Pacebacteria bacterium]|nr:hypothetical protein [Candidatus Paceibacterota bacterium]
MKVKPLFFCLFVLIFESVETFAERKVLDVPCVGQVINLTLFHKNRIFITNE